MIQIAGMQDPSIYDYEFIFFIFNGSFGLNDFCHFFYSHL